MWICFLKLVDHLSFFNLKSSLFPHKMPLALIAINKCCEMKSKIFCGMN